MANIHTEQVNQEAKNFELTDGIYGFKKGVEYAQARLYSDDEFLERLLSFKEKFMTISIGLTPETITEWFISVKK